MGSNLTITSKNVTCDLCGKDESPQGKIHRVHDAVYLCTACQKQIESLPSSVRGDVEERLIGNVI